jgi:hypothetical protein
MFKLNIVALLATALAVSAQPGCPIPSYPVSCDADLGGPAVCNSSQVCVLDVRTDVEVHICVPREPCRYTGPNQQSNCNSSDKWCYQTDVGPYCLKHPIC